MNHEQIMAHPMQAFLPAVSHKLHLLGMVIHNINKGINKSINGTGLLVRTFYLAPQLYFKVTCTCELTMLRLTNISFSQDLDANLTRSSLKITCPAFLYPEYLEKSAGWSQVFMLFKCIPGKNFDLEFQGFLWLRDVLHCLLSFCFICLLCSLFSEL